MRLIVAISQEKEIDRNEISGALAELHNEKRIDLIQITSSKHLDQLDNHLFFSISHLIQQAIPEIAAKPAQIVDAITYLVRRGGNDLAANYPFNALDKWCERNNSAAEQIVCLARDGHDGALGCLTKTLSILKDHDLAAEFAFDFDGAPRLSGISALAHIPFSSEKEALSVIERLAGIDTDDDDLMTRGNILVAVCAIFARTDGVDIEDAMQPLTKVMRPMSREIAFAILHALFQQSENLSEADLEFFLGELDPAQLDDVHPSHIEQTLSLLLRGGFHETTIDFIKRWLVKVNPDQGEKHTRDLLRDIKTLPLPVQQEIFVDWMLAEDVPLQNALVTIYSELEAQSFEIALEMLPKELTEYEKILLCRKTLGYFWVTPLVSAGVIKSTLNECGDDAAEHIIDILKNSLLINFPGNEQLLSFLNEDLEEHSRGTSLMEAMDWVEQISASFGKEAIKELLPPAESRPVNSEILREQQKDFNKETIRVSPIFQLVPRHRVVMGSSALQYVRDGEELRPIETKIGQIEVSAQMPSQHAFDPVGFQIGSLMLRRARLRP